MSRLNIAIDGPAGAGKSTAAKALAGKLGVRYLDTGAMYRTMALYVLRTGADPGDEAAVAGLLPGADIRVGFSEAGQRAFIGAEDVTGLIRTPEISMGASKVSAHPCVRIKLADMQRKVAEEYDVVMDGRDITTNVLKDSPYKFFITASPEERAKRRLLELRGKGDASADYETVLADMKQRDEQDSTRAFMPLTVAPDAVVVDTTGMDVEEVLDRLLSVVAETQQKRRNP